MTEKEKAFYTNYFYFSYSSLNKLLFSPSLFYKDYILNEKEERLDKHLVEGKLIHCLVFEPENVTKKFKITPNKIPTDNVRKIIHKVGDTLRKTSNNDLANDISDVDLMSKDLETIILDALKEENLYQTLKEDSARLSKIQCEENIDYWNFVKNPKVDVIDQDTLNRCKQQADIIMNNKEVKTLLSHKKTDFALDPVESFVETYLECSLKEHPFGLKGFLDFYEINNETLEVTICDLKTTSKSINEFPETVNYYNYWLQAAIYCKLVYNTLPKEKRFNFKINFKFIVIDKYDQVYVFPVSQETLVVWANDLKNALNEAKYHYINNDYSLPYSFLQGIVL